jgi:diphthamide biosynthesis protein 2
MVNKDTTIVVLYDLMNSYSILLLKEECQKKSVNNIIFGLLNEERVIQNMPKELDDNSQQGINSTDDSTSIVTYEVNGLLFSVPYQHKNTFKFFFIGEDSTQLAQIIMDFNSHQFVIFSHLRNELDESSDSASRINRILKRRYYLVQLAKEAQVIGIIVATVSVENYLTILAYVKKLIVDTGKKFYVFFVGKINVPKLANFAEIDIFCLISCAQNSLIDSKEFLKPIVTPFELELALKKDKEWRNEYISDFNKLLELNRHNLPANNISESERKEDEYDYSFITGSIRRSTKSTASSSNLTDADGFSNELVHIDPSKQQLSLSEMTPSMLYLQSRTYKGLEQNNDETPIATIEEGRSGIAMGYTHENKE